MYVVVDMVDIAIFDISVLSLSVQKYSLLALSQQAPWNCNSTVLSSDIYPIMKMITISRPVPISHSCPPIPNVITIISLFNVAHCDLLLWRIPLTAQPLTTLITESNPFGHTNPPLQEIAPFLRGQYRT